MTTLFEAFTNEVQVYFPDLPDLVVLGAVRNAAIEFCEKSLFWTYEHPSISAVEAVNSYSFSPPSGTEVARIIDGWYDGNTLIFASEERLQGQFSTPWRQTTGAAAFITQMGPSSFLLAPAPAGSIANAIRLVVALKPTRTATGIDDMFYSRWLEEIAGGARARLYAVPGHQNFNPALAMQGRRQFATDISTARIERNRGLTRATLAVRPKSWV